MLKRLPIIFSLLVIFLAACAPAAPATPARPRTLTVMTHDSFAVSEAVVRAFEEQNDAIVRFIPAGDAGLALNKAILARGNPIADVLYGVDNTFLSRALQEDIFERYDSPLLEQIPASFQLDAQNRALPVDYGEICPNYDKAYFASHNLPPPQSLDDLIEPQYKGLLAVEDPATSSPGLGFLLATIAAYGEDGYLDYWQRLAANDVLVAGDWNKTYYSEFSLHGGSRPIVISYASSPPAEVIFAETPLDDAPSGVVTGGMSCFQQIEFVGVLRGAKERQLAEKWIDYMLSPAFQEDMPLQMFVFPVHPEATLPAEFERYAPRPAETARFDPQRIAEEREAWVKAWIETMRR
ncbi:MAG: thiamine ABC transporter substrate-binding protein [Chloroflexi bacterium]|nr:thiamine ABC transporter substrate-binding protein [Chloroflexota bacterium]